MAVLALDDMFDWLHKGGMVAIYDATNSTVERRKLLSSRCKDEDVRVVFIESICEDPEIIKENLKETKLRSPEYVLFLEKKSLSLSVDKQNKKKKKKF